MDPRTDSIKQDLNDTRRSMTEKIDAIEGRVRGTVDDVKQSAHDAVDNVKQSAYDMVDTVKEKLDVHQLVDDRPWTALGVSLAVGFALGKIGGGSSSRRNFDWDRDYSRAYSTSNWSGSYPRFEDREQQNRGTNDWRPATSSSLSSSKSSSGSGFMADVKSQFGEELDVLRAAAVTAGLKFLHDVVRQNAPQLATEVDRVRRERGLGDLSSSSSDSMSRSTSHSMSTGASSTSGSGGGNYRSSTHQPSSTSGQYGNNRNSSDYSDDSGLDSRGNR
jgi:ElaB/YqjD/DUF883 family membrane-anchored ribosome-binding protein